MSRGCSVALGACSVALACSVAVCESIYLIVEAVVDVRVVHHGVHRLGNAPTAGAAHDGALLITMRAKCGTQDSKEKPAASRALAGAGESRKAFRQALRAAKDKTALCC